MYNSDWYNSLTKPFLAPPNSIFTPVWGILYLIIAISFFIFIFKKTDYDKRKGYIIFFSQIILNLLWSPAFFIMQNMVLALIIVIFMDILVFFNIKEFYRVSKTSGLMLIPYFLWIIFATYLNAGYLYLN